MNILHLGKYGPPTEGGIEVFSYDLLEYLNNNKIKADLLCFGDKNEEGDFRNFHYYMCKIEIKINSAPISIRYIKLFKEIEKNYDIIHVHSPNPLTEMLTLNCKKKVVVHWHSDIVKQKILFIFYKPIQQLFLSNSTKIICTSPQYLKVSNQLKAFCEKTEIIPLGLKENRLIILENDEIKNKDKYNFYKEIKKNKKIVLAIGRLVVHKGYKYLIEAGKYLNDNIDIIIVGDGPLFKNLEDQIKYLHLNERIYLIGKVDIGDIKYYLKDCDIVCFSSIMESFGLALVESLHFGKPLITTNVIGSGMNYVNQHEETGLIVPPRDPKALAEAINKVLSDKKLYNKFSENALKRFNEFDISTIGEKVIKLYENVLKE